MFITRNRVDGATVSTFQALFPRSANRATICYELFVKVVRQAFFDNEANKRLGRSPVSSVGRALDF